MGTRVGIPPPGLGPALLPSRDAYTPGPAGREAGGRQELFRRVCRQGFPGFQFLPTTQPSGQSVKWEKATSWPCDLGREADLSEPHLWARGQCHS